MHALVTRGPWLVVAVSVLMGWMGNGSVPLWDRDEPRFATAAREMADRGDWVVPTFNGNLRPDKPILIYWLMRGAYAVLGEGPFAARFFSAVGAGVSCLLVYHLGRMLFSARAGLVASWMLALSPMLVVESKLATVDAVLLALTTGCFVAAWQAWREPANRLWPACFWVVMAAAVLTKGPVGFAVVFGSLAVTALLNRDAGWLTVLISLRRWWGPALFVALVLPWCLAVHWATDGEFLRQSLGHHVIKRSLEPLERHAGFPGFYVVSLLGLMAPWSWFLPWVLWTYGRALGRDPRLAFLAGWIVFPLVLFELVRTKLVHYYLPAYPALALLISATFLESFAGQMAGVDRLRTWGRRLGPIAGVAGVAAALAGVVAVAAFLPPAVIAPAVAVLAVFALGSLSTGFLLWRQRWEGAFRSHAVATVVAFLLIGGWLLPALGEQRLIVAVAQRLRERSHTEAVALWHYCDPSLMFNFGRLIPWIDYEQWHGDYPEARALAQSAGSFLCPMTDDDLALMARDPQLRLAIDESITQFDLHGLKPRTIHLVRVAPAVEQTAQADADADAKVPR